MRRHLALIPLAAAALAACDQPTDTPQRAQLPEDGARAGAVEHWAVQRGGYHLTFYPGFASRAVVTAAGGPAVELYRQHGGFRLKGGAGRASGMHQVVLKGGPFARDLGLTVRDPGHAIARIEVELYGTGYVAGSGRAPAIVETVTLDNLAMLCPPNCVESGEPQPEPIPVGVSHLASRLGAPSLAPVVSRAAGYEVSVDPSFASRIVATMSGGRTAEIFRQRETFRLPAGIAAPSTEHQIRLLGGPGARDVTVGVRDAKHHVAAVRLFFYRGRGGAPADSMVTVMNLATTCPPTCRD
jgi:hypothetical protein